MPITVPVRVRSSAPAALAMPKSVTFTGPSRRHEHVGGLHVAVHEPGAVRGVERVGHLLADADDVGDGEAAVLVDEVAQGRAVDQLHHDVGDAVVVAGVVGGDDVGVREAGRGDRLVAEPGAGARRRPRGRRGAIFTATRRDSTGSSAIQTVAIPPRASGSTSW